jgi:hypothetical protein
VIMGGTMVGMVGGMGGMGGLQPDFGVPASLGFITHGTLTHQQELPKNQEAARRKVTLAPCASDRISVPPRSRCSVVGDVFGRRHETTRR